MTISSLSPGLARAISRAARARSLESSDRARRSIGSDLIDPPLPRVPSSTPQRLQRTPEAHPRGVLAHAEAQAAVREGQALQQAQSDDLLLGRREPAPCRRASPAGSRDRPRPRRTGRAARPRVARAPRARARPIRSCRRRAAAPRGPARRGCSRAAGSARPASRSTNTSCVRSSARSELPVRYARPRATRRAQLAIGPVDVLVGAVPPCTRRRAGDALPRPQDDAERARMPTQASASRASPTVVLGRFGELRNEIGFGSSCAREAVQKASHMRDAIAT